MKTENERYRSIRTKLILPVSLVMAILLALTLFFFLRVNAASNRLNMVYATNVSLNEVEAHLTRIQQNTFQYLNVQNEESLTAAETEMTQFQDAISPLNHAITNQETSLLEHNIYQLAGNIDFLAYCLACNQLCNLFVSLGSGNHLVPWHINADGHTGTNLAHNLKNNLNSIFYSLCLVVCWPLSLVNHTAEVHNIPHFLCYMRSEGIEEYSESSELRFVAALLGKLIYESHHGCNGCISL